MLLFYCASFLIRYHSRCSPGSGLSLVSSWGYGSAKVLRWLCQPVRGKIILNKVGCNGSLAASSLKILQVVPSTQQRQSNRPGSTTRHAGPPSSMPPRCGCTAVVSCLPLHLQSPTLPLYDTLTALSLQSQCTLTLTMHSLYSYCTFTADLPLCLSSLH